MNSQEMEMLQAGRFSELIGILEKKLEANPMDSEIKLDLALTYSQSGKHYEAIKLYEEMLTEDRNNVEVLISIGIVYHWVGESQKALETYQKAIRLTQERPVAPEYLSLAYSNLGVVFEALAHFEKAVIAYKKALSIFPDNQMASEYLAQLQEYGDTRYGLLRVKVLPNGKRMPDFWYYYDFDLDGINVDEVLGISQHSISNEGKSK